MRAPPRLMLTGPSQLRHSSPLPPHEADALGSELRRALRRSGGRTSARLSASPGQEPRCGRELPPGTIQAKTIVSLKQLCIQAPSPGSFLVHPHRAPPSCTPIVHDAASLTPLCTAYPQLEAAELTSEETAVPLPLCARMCGGAAAVEQRATVRSSVHRPAHGVMRSTGHAFPPHARPAAAAAAAAEQ